MNFIHVMTLRVCLTDWLSDSLSRGHTANPWKSECVVEDDIFTLLNEFHDLIQCGVFLDL